ncbi:asparaginase [Vreelandella malpeensis]|uniref:Asparaginase n=1 Tax=Vreelandella malpeensis TaxID=1172368 RepID=A0ABS8DX31_9GAMM|nr:asparaginase [Halomonas malpeensis]MCB8890390.1 asparaginase [Halomonas malpeensis]
MSVTPLLSGAAKRGERILVIYTGGTLGMQAGAAGLEPGANFEARLQRALDTLSVPQQSALPPFEVMSFDTLIDSSAATPLTWQRIAAAIAKRFNDYRGFVVLHGTDTLSFSAASLAFQLQGLDRPVVLTGAMRPLEAEHSDALANVYGALRFAASDSLKEVAIYFAGKLLRGVRAVKCDSEAPDAFASPGYPLLGERVGEDFIEYPARGLAATHRGAPRFELASYAGLAQGEVVRLALWPGIAAWQLEALLGDDRVKGALLQLWGAGNLPDDPALLEVLARACGEGKLIAATSLCPRGGVHFATYAAGAGLEAAGVLAGADMTPEAALTKLVHLLAQPMTQEDRRRRFVTPLCGER